MKERWTNEDERQLMQMQERRARLLKEGFEPLAALVADEALCNCANNKEIAECLMKRADEFRDALEPFDSGIRCAKDGAA